MVRISYLREDWGRGDFSRRVGENITSNFSTTNPHNIGDC